MKNIASIIKDSYFKNSSFVEVFTNEQSPLISDTDRIHALKAMGMKVVAFKDGSMLIVMKEFYSSFCKKMKSVKEGNTAETKNETSTKNSNKINVKMSAKDYNYLTEEFAKKFFSGIC